MVGPASQPAAAPEPDIPERTTFAAPDNRPNILLITADDMAASDLRWMPHTRKLLGGRGVSFSDAISPHPLCCPARAEILTGQYAQNNGVQHNVGPYGGFQALDENHTIATWLHDAGYSTGFVGKYLNGYSAGDGKAPGWTRFNPTIKRTYAPYGFTTFNNGSPIQYFNLYTTDWVAQETNRYIHQFSARNKPFFIFASHIAPHGMKYKGKWVPPIPAKRHADLFGKVKPPSLRDPAFNERNVSDKPTLIRSGDLLRTSKITRLFRERIRSLQSVDEAVLKSVRALRRTGELSNTLIVFTSDNGYLLGEHRFVGKNVPYEQALKVPMLVRGPTIPDGVTRRQTVSMIDLAPTFLQFAKTSADHAVDGRSMVPVLRNRNARGYRTSLIQAGTQTEAWRFRGVRTRRYTYVRHSDGFEELYDRKNDPSQLLNIAGLPTYSTIQKDLVNRLAGFETCAGQGCRNRAID
jgi:N-acetylglucosamine-6-sulfatase